jgi:cytochrome oxidase Cu insertion factor (SCO1/SenC/PrrC family)
VKLFHITLIFSSLALMMVACTPAQTTESQSTATPDWFDMELTDAQTGKTFTMNDYAGKVVLLETMAIWCPNCIVQANEVRNLHKMLGNPDDLISVTLDVDLNEDEASLKEYAAGYGFDWHFAVAPLLVARALGNLYSAQYLNPPLSPMLIIDRDGNVHQLEYGFKDADTLQEAVEPYLAQ